MKIKFRKFSPSAAEPFLATAGSACYDLFSTAELLISPRSCHCIKTNIGLSIAKGCFGKIHTRSSWAKKFTSVEVGVIDSDYRGNIIVIFHYYSKNWFRIRESNRIANFHTEKSIEHSF